MTLIGIIGGSGLYSLEGLTDVETVELNTPFGTPSSPVTIGRLSNTCSNESTEGTESDIRLAFIARHGPGHRIMPSAINYRANIFALKSLGANWCISVSAVGSLVEEMRPGDLVVPNQIIDLTKQRQSTFFDSDLVAHVSLADPFCPVLSELLYCAAKAESSPLQKSVHRGATAICIEGPAFSSRAESNLFRQWGAQIIGMTSMPEVRLAREAELSYATLALVTDYDCWRANSEDVDVSQVIAILSANVELARHILTRVAQQVAHAKQPDFIENALRHAIISNKRELSSVAQSRLEKLICKYIEPTNHEF